MEAINLVKCCRYSNVWDLRHRIRLMGSWKDECAVIAAHTQCDKTAAPAVYWLLLFGSNR